MKEDAVCRDCVLVIGHFATISLSTHNVFTHTHTGGWTPQRHCMNKMWRSTMFSTSGGSTIPSKISTQGWEREGERVIKIYMKTIFTCDNLQITNKIKIIQNSLVSFHSLMNSESFSCMNKPSGPSSRKRWTVRKKRLTHLLPFSFKSS